MNTPHYFPHLSVVLLASALVACSGEQPTDDVETDIEETDEPEPDCIEDTDCADGSICEESECIAGDRDNEFGSAMPILLNEVRGGEINPAGDSDYWVYTSPGEEWLRVQTVTEGGEADTVVSVFRENGARHAVMDDYATGSVTTYDTVLHVYLPEPGPYFFSVQDKTTYEGETPAGGPGFDYTIELLDYSAVTEEPDALGNPSTTVNMTSGSSIWSVGVVIEEDGDSDHIAVQMPWGEAPVEIYGQQEIPGSDADILVRMYDSDRNLLLEKADVGPAGTAAYFDGQDTTYWIEATDADGVGSQDHWYVLYFRTRDTGWGYDRETEPNDTPELQNALDNYEYETNSGTAYEAAQFQGILEAEGDEDWFAVTLPSSLYFTVRCSAEVYGSLVDLAVDVTTWDGETVLESVLDGDDSTPDAFNLGPYDPGTYLLRVYAEGDTPFYGPGAYYRCFVPMTSFEVSN